MLVKKLSKMPYAQRKVIIADEGIYLISYTTTVCRIDAEGWLTCTGTYSQTTRKHISAFMQEYARGWNYYTAKQCYTDGVKLNIYTAEIMDI